MTFFPTFRYHPTEAPQGRKFTDEAEFTALGEDWVDTPAKLPAPDELGIETPAPPPARRGRKATEAV